MASNEARKTNEEDNPEFRQQLFHLAVQYKFSWEKVSSALNYQFYGGSSSVSPTFCRMQYSKLMTNSFTPENQESGEEEQGAEVDDDLDALLSSLVEEEDEQEEDHGISYPQQQHKEALVEAPRIPKSTTNMPPVSPIQKPEKNETKPSTALPVKHESRTPPQSARTHTTTNKRNNAKKNTLENNIEAELDKFDPNGGVSFWDYTQALLGRAHQRRREKINGIFDRVVSAMGAEQLTDEEKEKLTAQIKSDIRYRETDPRIKAKESPPHIIDPEKEAVLDKRNKERVTREAAAQREEFRKMIDDMKTPIQLGLGEIDLQSHDHGVSEDQAIDLLVNYGVDREQMQQHASSTSEGNGNENNSELSEVLNILSSGTQNSTVSRGRKW